MNRTAWVASLGLALLGLGVLVRVRWAAEPPALACDGSDVRWLDGGGGFFACAPDLPRADLPVGAARMLGVKVDLNQVPEQELAQVPGVGPKLAHALVAGRQAREGFQSWAEVGGVPGVGPTKLRVLQDLFEIRGSMANPR